MQFSCAMHLRVTAEVEFVWGSMFVTGVVGLSPLTVVDITEVSIQDDDGGEAVAGEEILQQFRRETVLLILAALKEEAKKLA